MLKITRSAWDRLSEIQSTRPDVTTMRLAQIGGRLKCHRGVQKQTDRVIQQEGCPSLLMTPTIARRLADRTLSAPKTIHGRRLRLKPLSSSSAAVPQE